MYIDSTVMAVRSYSATGARSTSRGSRLQARLVEAAVPAHRAGFQRSQLGLALPECRTPRCARWTGRLGGTYGFNYDLRQHGFLQQRITGYYNSQCCGLAVDYQMVNVSQFALSRAFQRDRRLAITFTLAGIGSFSSPLGAFGR